jgi:hypothetical protein
VIDKREIIDSATALGLNPHVVEKDYVLGWLLWGIHNHDALRESWVFKGGTCLKKCFFETYRFSEDLDFTLTDPGTGSSRKSVSASMKKQVSRFLPPRSGSRFIRIRAVKLPVRAASPTEGRYRRLAKTCRASRST